MRATFDLNRSRSGSATENPKQSAAGNVRQDSNGPMYKLAWWIDAALGQERGSKHRSVQRFESRHPFPMSRGRTKVVNLGASKQPRISRAAHLAPFGFEIGCGGRIRTDDLRVMSPTSCRCSTPRSQYTAALTAGWLGLSGSWARPRERPRASVTVRVERSRGTDAPAVLRNRSAGLPLRPRRLR